MTTCATASPTLVKRVLRKRATKSQRSRLQKFLRQQQIPIFDDQSVEQYKLKKVVSAQHDYVALGEDLKRFEKRLTRARKFIDGVLAVTLLVCGFGVLCACVSLIGTITSWKFGLSALPYFIIALRGSVMGFGASFAVAVATAYYNETWLVPMCHRRREAFGKASRRCGEIYWTKGNYFSFARQERVPKRVKRLVQMLSNRFNDATLTVEYTQATKQVEVEDVPWSYLMDPFLRVTLGRESYCIAAWDEDGFEPETVLYL